MADKRRKSEAVRRARLDQERRERAARRKRLILITAPVAVVVLIVVIVAVTGPKPTFVPTQVSGLPNVDPNTFPGILTGPAPWSNNTADLSARLAADQLPPASAMEGQVVHTHQHLDIYIRGRSVEVPAFIGIATKPTVIFAPIHTHDASGIIHVESPIQRDFSLGEFFDVWGVRLTSTCIGGYCTSGKERLQVFANGKVVTFDPRLLKLIEHEEIVVTFGTPSQIPTPYPITYPFPAGL